MVDAGHEYDDVKNDFTLYSSILSDYGVISIHDTDDSFEKDLIVTEDVKEKNHHAPFDGPNKLIKELKDNMYINYITMEPAAVVKQKIKRKESKLTSIYSRCLITRNIVLPITAIGKNIKGLEEELKEIWKRR